MFTIQTLNDTAIGLGVVIGAALLLALALTVAGWLLQRREAARSRAIMAARRAATAPVAAVPAVRASRGTVTRPAAPVLAPAPPAIPSPSVTERARELVRQ